MKRAVCVALVVLFLAELPLWAGLGSHNTMYVGGTVTDLKEKTEGKSNTADEKSFVFEYKGGKLQIPYAQIDSLEYGQKAGRRVGLGVVVSPFFLFSKKRRHYLTIGWTDEQKKQQAAVFELGKDIIKPTLQALEAKSGKKVDYQDAEARKTGTGS
jgi:hypothetical protein